MKGRKDDDGMWKRRMTAVWLIVSLLVAVLPEMPAAAAALDSEYIDVGSCGTNITYVLGRDGVLRIAGEGEMTSFASASAVPWHQYRQLITGVTFSGKVKNISDHAFEYCIELTDITIPETVSSIGTFAFRGCSGMTDVSLPDSVERIGEGAFDGTGVDVSQIAFRRGSCGENLQWELRGDYRLYITGTGAMTDFSAASAPWHEFRAKIVELVLSGEITHIGNYAFEGCTAVSEVVPPDSLTDIGKYAFSGCSGIKSIHLDKKITAISDHAFYKSGLEQVVVTGSSGLTMGGYVFADCTRLRQVTFAGSFEKLGDHMFQGCSALDNSFTLPAELTELGDYAFQNCTGISKIDLPSSLRTINAGAFSGCTKISALPLPDSVECIGKSAFEKCSAIKEFVIPNTVKEIGEGAFSGCSSLERLTLPFVGKTPGSEAASAETLFGFVFGKTSYTGGTAVRQSYSDKNSVTYYVPDALKTVSVTGGTLRYGAFDKCAKIESLQLAGTVSDVAPYAFRGCTGLTELRLPDSLQTIGDGAFSGCTELVSVKIPEKIVHLPASLFQGCAKLKNLTYSNRVESIGDYAFAGCVLLGEWSLPSTLAKIGNGVWKGCTGIQKISLPSGITRVGDELFAGCEKLCEVSLPSTVTEIGSQAFSGCQALQGLTVPANTEKIGAGAFKNCTGVETVTLPSAVNEIGSGAFSGCSGLKQMTLPFAGGSRAAVTSSASTLFGYIFGTTSYAGGTLTRQSHAKGSASYYIPSSLRTVTLADGPLLYGTFQNCSGLTEINLPAGVTGVEAYVFRGCTGLKKIVLPETVTSIGSYAFQNCSGLTEINIPDSVTAIGSSAFSGCKNLTQMTLPFVGADKDRTQTSSQTVFGYIFGTARYDGGTATRQYYSNAGSGTFYLPSALRSVKITGGAIMQGAFDNCGGLTGIFLPDDLKEVGKHAFRGCRSLTQMTLPAGVRSVQEGAFADCTDMKTVTFLGSAPDIHEKAFAKDAATVCYPKSDPSWLACVGKQYGGTLTWEAHSHRYATSVVAPTCTEQGYTKYQCMDCKSYYLSDYVSETGHKPVSDAAVPATCMKPGLTEGSHCAACKEVLSAQKNIPVLAHSFTSYVSNQDATYEADGTKTAGCDFGCGTKDTIADSGSRLQDTTPPVIQIVSGSSTWKEVLHPITFGLFFQKTQRVTIEASDKEALPNGSSADRLKQVYYSIADREVPPEELESLAWSGYDRPLSLHPGKKYVVYAKAVDLSGNTSYASSDGMIVDNEFPAIEGVTDGKSYCEEAVFTVRDLSLSQVTDNGKILVPADGRYVVAGDDLQHTIVAADHSGNTVTVTITIYKSHAWSAYTYNEDVTCTTSGTKTAVCAYGCGTSNTEVDENHPPAGHRYAQPEWKWADDNKSCAARFVCTADDSHVEEKACTVTASSADATCTTSGEVVFTASVDCGDKTWRDSRAVSDAVLGHAYAAEFHWSGDYQSCTADFVCQRKGCTPDTAGHERKGEPCAVKTKTTPASCVSTGMTETVAEVAVEGVTYTNTGKREELPVDASHHVHTQIVNRREATCRNTGYSGDVYCNDCRQRAETGHLLERTDHTWNDGETEKEATEEEPGIRIYTCLVCGEKRVEAIPTLEKDPDDPEPPSPTPPIPESPLPPSSEPEIPGGTENPSPTPLIPASPAPVTTQTPVEPGQATVQLPAAPTGSDTGKRKPDSRTKGTLLTDRKSGAVYEVHSSDTVYYKEGLRASGTVNVPAEVTIGGRTWQVTGISAKAFQGNKKIKKVILGSRIKIIGRQAFYGCRSLKTVVVRTKKLTKKTVGSKAFAKIHKKAVVKVPAKKQKIYRNLFRKRGVSGKKQKIKK